MSGLVMIVLCGAIHRNYELREKDRAGHDDMAMRDYIIIDHVQGGQPRPYADSIFSAYISKRREGVLTNSGKFYVQLQESDVREITRLFVRRFDDEPANHWRPRLEECRRVEPTTEMIEESAGADWKPGPGSRWFVKVIEAYTD